VPPETATTSEPDIQKVDPASPKVQLCEVKSLKPDQPVIAEATSSADDIPMTSKDSPESSPPDFTGEEDYIGDIGSHVELSSDGMPTKWCHQQEHDYLKNVIEPEPSGMDETSFENGSIDEDMDEVIEADPETRMVANVSRINSYDTELPQEIFHKPENIAMSYQTSLMNNFVHHQEPQPVIVRQVVEPGPTRFNTAVIMQEEQNEPTVFQHDNFVMDDAQIEGTRSYSGKTELAGPSSSSQHFNLADEIHMNVTKNVKLLAFPSRVKYNEKYIIEEVCEILKIS